MDLPQRFSRDIFRLSGPDHFNALALEIFHYQYLNNPIYHEFVTNLHIFPEQVDHITKIPFLPAEFFKSKRIISGKSKPTVIFTSSGTTGQVPARHFVADPDLYSQSYHQCFAHFYGDIREYIFIALLPSYLEREGSSLVVMADGLIRASQDPLSGFCLHDPGKLYGTLEQAKKSGKKVMLLGVSYALLDAAENNPISFPGLIVMETGGMKGMRGELTREDLHLRLCKGFGVEHIHSEYGMTELLSQAYSKGQGTFYTPPWMKILIRDVNDPLSPAQPGRSGGINIIDLANMHSCAFIASMDLGKAHDDGSFNVLGRFDHSDIRGCNLMIEGDS